MKDLEDKGRKGDEFLAHLTPGEIVIPRALAEDNDFRGVVAEFMRQNDIDPYQFIVGSGKNSTNPETGYMEFGFFSSIGRAFNKVVGSIFGDKPKAPPVPKLPPPPTTQDSEQGGEYAMKAAAGRGGYQKTILAGALTPKTGKKTVLG